MFDDRYLNMELALPKGDDPNPQLAKVTKRLRDANGIPIGMANDNPILDSRMYKVKYQEGTKASLAANYITENMFAQVTTFRNSVLFPTCSAAPSQTNGSGIPKSAMNCLSACPVVAFFSIG